MPSQDLGMLNKMVKSARREHVRRVRPRQRAADARDEFLGWAKGWPCQQPPWGEMLAVNVNTGDIAWRVPLGSFEELDALGVPTTGTPNRGGPIATAGGLVFIAASQDARFRAFDAQTGKVLWVAESDGERPRRADHLSGEERQAVRGHHGGRWPASGKKSRGEPIGGRLHVYALPE